MEIDDTTTKRQFTRTLVFAESSDDDSLLDKNGEPSFLQISREGEESDSMEDELGQSEAKTWLNDVFVLLDFPKVSNW